MSPESLLPSRDEMLQSRHTAGLAIQHEDLVDGQLRFFGHVNRYHQDDEPDCLYLDI